MEIDLASDGPSLWLPAQIVIETCGDNQCDKKGNQADGNADESQNDVFVLYRWFHIFFSVITCNCHLTPQGTNP